MNEVDSTDILIESLTEDLEPVKPIASPLYSVIPWVIVTAIYTAFITFSLGIRADIGAKLLQPTFLFEVVTVVFIGLTAVISSAFLRYPDVRGHKWLIAVPCTLFAVMVLWHCCQVYADGFKMPELYFHHCVKESGILGGIPILIMMLIVRRGATTHPYWMAAMNMLAVGSVGWLGLRVACMADNIGHTFMYHFFPYIVLGLIMSALAKKLYSW